MVVAAGTVVVAMVALLFPLWNFRRRHPVLRDDADMAAFKRLASTQMYVSFVALKLTWIPLIVWLVGKFALGHSTLR